MVMELMSKGYPDLLIALTPEEKNLIKSSLRQLNKDQFSDVNTVKLDLKQAQNMLKINHFTEVDENTEPILISHATFLMRVRFFKDFETKCKHFVHIWTIFEQI